MSWGAGFPVASRLRLTVRSGATILGSQTGVRNARVTYTAPGTASVLRFDVEALASPGLLRAKERFKLTISHSGGPIAQSIPTASECEGKCPAVNGNPAEYGQPLAPGHAPDNGNQSIEVAIPFRHSEPIRLSHILLFTKRRFATPGVVAGEIRNCSSCASCVKTHQGCRDASNTGNPCPSTGTPGPNILATFTTVITENNLRWWRAPLVPTSGPLQFNACQTFFVVIKTTTSIYRPTLATGNGPEMAPYFTKSGTTWNRETNPLPWAICFKCPDSATEPTSTAVTLPYLGSTFQIDIDCVNASSPGALILGTASLSLNMATPPRTMLLLTVPDTSVPIMTNASGQALVPLAIPPSSTLLGAVFYTQFAVADAPTLAPGFVLSNSLKNTIGY